MKSKTNTSSDVLTLIELKKEQEEYWKEIVKQHQNN